MLKHTNNKILTDLSFNLQWINKGLQTRWDKAVPKDKPRAPSYHHIMDEVDSAEALTSQTKLHTDEEGLDEAIIVNQNMEQWIQVRASKKQYARGCFWHRIKTYNTC